MFYKDHIQIKERADLVMLHGTIVAEIRLKSNKKGVFSFHMYRSPSKSSVAEIDTFCEKMTQMVDKMKEENPLSIILTGDFNGRSSHFWEHELIENAAGKQLVDFSILNGILNQPTSHRKI